jgi:hypothetical protein
VIGEPLGAVLHESPSEATGVHDCASRVGI